MGDDLRFDLPARPASKKRATFLVAVVAFGVGAAAGHFGWKSRSFGAGPATTAGGGALLSREEQVALAETLEKNQLYAEAARAWQRAAELSPPSGAEKAEVLFRIGKNLALANQQESALAFLFAAEAADSSGRWKQSINRLVLEGLSALGREDARVYQAQRRTSLAPQADKDSARPVAEIGGEPISELDLQTFARRLVTAQFASQRAMLPPDAVNQAIEAQLEKLKTPDGRKQWLHRYISQELLYREALAAKQPDRAEVQEQVADARRHVLIQAFLDDYLSRNMHVGETDVKNAYEAGKAQYREPEAVRAAAIVVQGEEAKKAVSAALDAGTDFDRVREKHSASRPSGESSDPFDRWMTREGRVPVVSDGKAALAHLFSLEKGEVSRKWFEGADGKWIRFRLLDHRKERPLELSECRDRVERDLRAKKQEEALGQLEQALRSKYKVVMHDEKATP